MASLREQWANGGHTLGAWLTIPSTVSAEQTARIGFDYCCIDMQHGAIDYQTAVAMTQAVVLGAASTANPATPIARVPWNEPGIIGKALDAGLQGVIVPMVNTGEEAAAVVRGACYPPVGARSFGPVLAGMRDSKYQAWAMENVAVIPMVETAEAIRNIDAILSTPGVDAIYVGPSDLSISLGLRPINNDGEAAFDDALATIIAACERHHVVAGIHSIPSLVGKRLEQGFRMITATGDLVSLKGSLTAELAQVRGSVPGKGSGSMY